MSTLARLGLFLKLLKMQFTVFIAPKTALVYEIQCLDYNKCFRESLQYLTKSQIYYKPLTTSLDITSNSHFLAKMQSSKLLHGHSQEDRRLRI